VIKIKCPRDLIVKLFDDKIETLEDDLIKAVKAGMPSSILYDELDELEALKDEIMEIFDCYCKKKDECEV
jgi:hypothetical protein